jgi:hypothetical protein
VRHYYVVAPGAPGGQTLLFCLTLGTTGAEEDARLFDELAARFDLIGDPPGTALAGDSGAPAEEPASDSSAALSVEGVRHGDGPYAARVRRVLVAAHDEALRRGAETVDEEHVLAGMVSAEEAVGLGALLGELGITPEQLRMALDSMLPPVTAESAVGPPAPVVGQDAVGQGAASLPFSERVQRTLALAEESGRATGRAYVGLEDVAEILLARETGPTAALLKRLGLTADAARTSLERARRQTDTA